VNRYLRADAAKPMAVKQRLLYLSAQSTDPRSPAISQALHEPVRGTIVEIDPTRTSLDYETVHDAICDGWRVVHFPDQRGSLDGSEIEVFGYQFVLEKLEQFDD
jgi:hypothetical protein